MHLSLTPIVVSQNGQVETTAFLAIETDSVDCRYWVFTPMTPDSLQSASDRDGEVIDDFNSCMQDCLCPSPAGNPHWFEYIKCFVKCFSTGNAGQGSIWITVGGIQLSGFVNRGSTYGTYTNNGSNGNNNNNGNGSLPNYNFNQTAYNVFDKYYDCLSEHSEISTAVWNKLYTPNGTAHCLTPLLDEALGMLCEEAQGQNISVLQFEEEYERAIGHFFEAVEESNIENLEICDEIKSLFSDWYFPPPPAVRLVMPDSLITCFTPSSQCSNCTYRVELFIEQPVPGTRAIHAPWGLNNPGTFKNGGHVFISLQQYDPTYSLLFPKNVKTFGWYPVNKPTGNEETPGFFYEENSNTVYNVSIGFFLNIDQFNSIIQTLATNHVLYQVERNNCGTVMANALLEAGLFIPRTTQYQWPLGNISCSPGDLGEDIKATYPAQVFFSNNQYYTPPLSNCH